VEGRGLHIGTKVPQLRFGTRTAKARVVIVLPIFEAKCPNKL
jgi:hypothetical protein